MQIKIIIVLGLLFTSLYSFGFDGGLSTLHEGKRIKIRTSSGTVKCKFDHFESDSVIVVRTKNVFRSIQTKEIKGIQVDKRGLKSGMKVGRVTGEVLGLIVGISFAIALEWDEQILMEAGGYTFGQLLSLPGGLIGIAFPHWVDI